MQVRINENATQFNCCWYCDKVGEVFNVRRSKTQNLYYLKIKGIVHLINTKHADIITNKG